MVIKSASRMLKVSFRVGNSTMMMILQGEPGTRGSSGKPGRFGPGGNTGTAGAKGQKGFLGHTVSNTCQ